MFIYRALTAQCRLTSPLAYLAVGGGPSSMLSSAFAQTPLLPSPSAPSHHRTPRCSLRPLAAALAASLLVPLAPSLASPPRPDGAALFERSCAACHAGGGNVIGFARGKNLKTKALQKYGYTDAGSIVALMREGRGIMPPYAVDAFSDEDAQAVAEFVLSAAERGWK